MKIALSFALAVTIGVACRLTGIPLPAPPAMVGAVLVLALTVGYRVADHYAARPARHELESGGPAGGSGAAGERQ